MHILINITPETQLSWPHLTTLIEEIRSQHFKKLSLNLQLPLTQHLSIEQRVTASNWSLSVNQPPLISADYLINLRETDHLLPGALQQWHSLATLHPQAIISLASFDNSHSPYEQIHDYLNHHQANSLQTTFSALAGPVTSSTVLWSLQKYTILPDLPSSHQLAQQLQPTGVLLPVSLLQSKYPLVSLNQTLSAFQSAAEVVRLCVPTFITQSWAATTPLAWLEQLQTVDVTGLDTAWQPLFTHYLQHQLTLILATTTPHRLTPPEHIRLLQQVQQLTSKPVHPWTRLALLQHISPQLAHLLFH